ncbi:ferredoxin [Streptomyces sp. NPDC101234]|uniref:ferredoxin n=1 Tax=Streptomyces sp. NPDC101234 TaxID=3366138 RepID=UPI00380D6B04
MTPLFAQRQAGTAAADPVPTVLSLGPGATRLTAGLRPRRAQERLNHSAHPAAHGPLPHPGELGLRDLLALTEQIALRGRGGAGSPFHRKLRAVMDSARRSGPTAAVVVDAVEGDPLCRKDERLLGALPLPSGPQAAKAAERFTMDWPLCDGHALCADVVPELIQMEQDGFPVLSAAAIPPRLAERARLAARRCPALALRVERI